MDKPGNVQQTASLPSGPWMGRWTQRRRQGLETLDLLVQGGSVQGLGHDEDGGFVTNGAAYPDGTVSLTKVYRRPVIPVPPSMSYIGKWDGRVVRGEWIDDRDPENHGPFLMWPGRGAAPAEEAEREATPPREKVPVRRAGAQGLSRG